MSATIRRRLLLAVLLPLPLLLALCGLLAWQIQVLRDRAGWVEHTRAVIAEAQLAQRLLLDQETGLRGFMLTGDPGFLAPYTEGRRALPRAVGTLTALTQDNAAQQRQLTLLNQQHQAWLSISERRLAEARLQNRPLLSGADLATARERKALMDRMRVTTGALVAEEERLLAERRLRAEQATDTALWAGSTVLGTVGLFLVWYVRRLITTVDQTYREVLAGRDASLVSERQARTVAEALAEEVADRSREMERAFVTVRAERDEAQRQLAVGNGGKG